LNQIGIYFGYLLWYVIGIDISKISLAHDMGLTTLNMNMFH